MENQMDLQFMQLSQRKNKIIFELMKRKKYN